MGKFFEKYNLLKLSHERIENMNSLRLLNKTEYIIKTFHKKIPSLDGFNWTISPNINRINITQTFPEKKDKKLRD